jgi:hypothetical protein
MFVMPDRITCRHDFMQSCMYAFMYASSATLASSSVQATAFRDSQPIQNAGRRGRVRDRRPRTRAAAELRDAGDP